MPRITGLPVQQVRPPGAVPGASFDGGQPPVLNCSGYLAYRLTGNWAVAQDVAQETWLVVIRGLITLKDVARFRAWLFRIASHKCQDHWRRKQTRQRFAGELQKQSDAAAAVPPNAERSDIGAAFRRLTPENRTVLALMYLENFSIGEIAEVLSLPEGTVKSRLFHARQQVTQARQRFYPRVVTRGQATRVWISVSAENREPLFSGPVETGSRISFGRAAPGSYVVKGRTERADGDFTLRIGGVDEVPGRPSLGRLFLLMLSAAVTVTIPLVWLQNRWLRRIDPELRRW